MNMTDSTDITQPQPSPISHSSGSKAAKSRSVYGLLLLWLVALFIAAAACAGGFLLDRKFSRAHMRLAKRQQAIERAFADLQSSVQTQQAPDTPQTQWAEQLTDVQNRLQALENLFQDAERGHENWKAAELEQMLAAANEQLKLTGNVSLALFALQHAAARLAADSSLRAQTARKAIERDIQALQTSPYAELAAKLELALAQADRLPLVSQPHASKPASISLEHFSVDLPKERARRQYGDRCGRSRSPSRSDGGDPAAIPNTENAEATQGKSVKNALAQTAGNPANTQSKEATQGQPLKNALAWTKWWERFSAGIAQQWSGLVQMRRIDRDHALLITPEQGLLARENLKLRLLSARLALLARNHALLKTDLQAAAHILRYFDAAAPAVQSVHDILSELVQASEAATTLNIDASVHAVRQYRSRS
ncbi:Uroporphyrin-III C-methyltransferase [Candidatus Glomeribacter gigasporarum BEG34]|uniref:Uroporphyrin-III C-methyltransferase n=2 Tax=Candidatus Glomeribacter gigasporarum TaxID=132144 RepID=G2J805_9BURK|nr:Uroporphyrin-III C-methyltransferase [Candidatus Glomeribacter gigasporarum BEG34]